LDEAARFCQACGQPALPGGSAAALVPGGPATPAVYANAADASQVQYAGFWLRFVAYVIDGLIVGTGLVVVLVPFAILAGVGSLFHDIHPGDAWNAPPMIFSAAILALVAISFVANWIYHAWMESSSWQATVGKRTLGIYVTDDEGRRISFARASGRHFSKIITGLVPFAIGFIMAGFTARKQALHDIIASCLVLRKM
jgi:uncharacterized RDD family membrane protein YckC